MAKELESLPAQQPSVICSNRREKHLRNEFYVYFLDAVIIRSRKRGQGEKTNITIQFFSCSLRGMTSTQDGTLKGVLIEEESKAIVMGEIIVL